MQKILIFEPFLSGHRLEYIHHLYEKAAKTPKNHYYFAVSNQFQTLKKLFPWSEADNITFVYLDQQFISSIKQRCKIRRIFSLITLASNLSKQHQVDEVFVICLAEYMPWLPLFFRARAYVSGIIYYIYLYEWKSKKFIPRMRDALTISSIFLFKKYKYAYLLNDPIAATYLNKKFKTGKFRYLPDPFMLPYNNDTHKINIKERLGIKSKDKLYLHFGSMSYRKGTLNILQAIALLTKEESENYCFVFAGKIGDDIKETFYTLYGILKEKVRIHVFDEFCTPEFLSSLCEVCSVILAPYYNTSFSSGIIGYAAYYKKPVVVPDEKFIGKLVRRYRLGFLLKDNSPQEIVHFIRNTHTFFSVDGTRYINTHRINDFVQYISFFE